MSKDKKTVEQLTIEAQAAMIKQLEARLEVVEKKSNHNDIFNKINSVDERLTEAIHKTCKEVEKLDEDLQDVIDGRTSKKEGEKTVSAPVGDQAVAATMIEMMIPPWHREHFQKDTFHDRKMQRPRVARETRTQLAVLRRCMQDNKILRNQEELTSRKIEGFFSTWGRIEEQLERFARMLKIETTKKDGKTMDSYEISCEIAVKIEALQNNQKPVEKK